MKSTSFRSILESTDLKSTLSRLWSEFQDELYDGASSDISSLLPIADVYEELGKDNIAQGIRYLHSHKKFPNLLGNYIWYTQEVQPNPHLCHYALPRRILNIMVSLGSTSYVFRPQDDSYINSHYSSVRLAMEQAAIAIIDYGTNYI